MCRNAYIGHTTSRGKFVFKPQKQKSYLPPPPRSQYNAFVLHFAYAYTADSLVCTHPFIVSFYTARFTRISIGLNAMRAVVERHIVYSAARERMMRRLFGARTIANTFFVYMHRPFTARLLDYLYLCHI